MKATERYVPVVLFIVLQKLILTVTLDENFYYDHSNENYSAIEYFPVVVQFVFASFCNMSLFIHF